MRKAKQRANTVVGYTASPHLHLIGSSQCVVDGLRGILEYTSERITIDLGSFCITVIGAELFIDELSPRGAIIQGDILSMELGNAN